MDNLLIEKDAIDLQWTKNKEYQQAPVLDFVRSDDPRKGGKLKSNKDQEEILEVDSFTNKVSYEVTTPSSTEISAFGPLKKMHDIISEAVQKVSKFARSGGIRKRERSESNEDKEVILEIDSFTNNIVQKLGKLQLATQIYHSIYRVIIYR